MRSSGRRMTKSGEEIEPGQEVQVVWTELAGFGGHAAENLAYHLHNLFDGQCSFLGSWRWQ